MTRTHRVAALSLEVARKGVSVNRALSGCTTRRKALARACPCSAKGPVAAPDFRGSDVVWKSHDFQPLENSPTPRAWSYKPVRQQRPDRVGKSPRATGLPDAGEGLVKDKATEVEVDGCHGTEARCPPAEGSAHNSRSPSAQWERALIRSSWPDSLVSLTSLRRKSVMCRFFPPSRTASICDR